MANLDDDQDEQVKKLIAGQMGPDVPHETSDTDATLEDKVTDSHPGHTPESMAQWVGGQEKQVDQYGPEQQKAVIDNIIRSRDSFGSRAANAGAGFADALMQGVAQQGPGNFQKALNDRENRTEEIQGNEIPQLATLNRQGMEQKQALEGMTSSSPLGASRAAPLLPIIKHVFPGKTDEEYAAMMANPDAVRSALGIETPLMEAQGRIAETHLANQTRQDALNEQIRNDAALRALEAQKVGVNRDTLAQTARQEETKNELDHPVMMGLKKLFGTTPAAITPDVAAYAQKHGISPEQALAIKQKRGGQ